MAVLNDASQVMAAQPGDDTSAATAPPAPPASTSGGIVNAAQPAANAVQQTPSAPQPSSAPAPTDPAAQVVQHHAAFGAAMKNLVHTVMGNDVQYKSDPQTGQVQEVVTPSAPGTFFRRLVAGMLVGAAAGSARVPIGKDGEGGSRGQNFSSGFSSGALAAGRQAQDTDQRQYDRAQEQLKNSQEQQRMTEDEKLHAAQIAHLNLQIADLQHNLHSADQETIEKHSSSVRAYEHTLTDIGGMPAKMQINGQLVDSAPANDFAKAYIKDPSLSQAGPGYQRHFIDENNVGELTWDGTAWRDESGNAARPDSVIRAIDVPTSTLKSYNSMPGKVVNQLAGAQVVDPDKSYSVSGEAAIALYNTGLKAAAEKARAGAQHTRAEKDRQFVAIDAKKQAALAKAESAYWQEVNGGKDPNDALTQLNQAKQNAQNAYEDEIRAAGGSAQHYEYGNAPAPQNQSSAQNRQQVNPPTGKSVVYDQQNNPHYVDSNKLTAFLRDPQYKGWHQ